MSVPDEAMDASGRRMAVVARLGNAQNGLTAIQERVSPSLAAVADLFLLEAMELQREIDGIEEEAFASALNSIEARYLDLERRVVAFYVQLDPLL